MTRILVVDDDREVREVIKQTLSDQGYQIIEASNGVEAYQMTVEAAVAERPDLIVLDIMLPQMNGYEVLEKLKANSQVAYIPVVIVSARNGTQDETRGMKAGAADYITKPWPPGELESRVKIALDHRRSFRPARVS